jgi:hypothetical protein
LPFLLSGSLVGAAAVVEGAPVVGSPEPSDSPDRESLGEGLTASWSEALSDASDDDPSEALADAPDGSSTNGAVEPGSSVAEEDCWALGASWSSFSEDSEPKSPEIATAKIPTTATPAATAPRLFIRTRRRRISRS